MESSGTYDGHLWTEKVSVSRESRSLFLPARLIKVSKNSRLLLLPFFCIFSRSGDKASLSSVGVSSWNIYCPVISQGYRIMNVFWAVYDAAACSGSREVSGIKMNCGANRSFQLKY